VTWAEVARVFGLGLATALRVFAMVVLASLVWVPLGVYVGLRPRLAQRVQPVVQFAAAFPANLLFPVVVLGIVHWQLDPEVWVSPLMVLGTQWYIVFNVIAGTQAIPRDVLLVSRNLGLRGWTWWRRLILPAIFPSYITGAVTAAGGSWNASIVAEAVRWGDVHLAVTGVGAYITRWTESGDFPRVALGIGVLSILVVALNRILWRPLYALSEAKLRLD
jgi:NitT/TauT family transport system permease protein